LTDEMAAVCAIRRAPHEEKNPRRLQEKVSAAAGRTTYHPA